MMQCGASFTSALISLGVGTGLLVYASNQDLKKLQKVAKVIGYFIIIVSLLSLFCASSSLVRCHFKSARHCGMKSNNACMDKPAAVMNSESNKVGKCPISEGKIVEQAK